MNAGIVLQLDLGNSRLKWRTWADGRTLARGACAPDDAAWLAQDPAPQAVQVASVADPGTAAALAARVHERWGIEPWFARSAARLGDLVNSYAEPASMGVDRWLAMVAARARGTGRLCVVDAGSALTIDLVAADGRHEGGYIIPGSALMVRSLLADTGRVRFAPGRADSLAPGQSTAACVHHGIALAQAGALKLALVEAADRGPAPRVIASGGGGAEVLRLAGLANAEYREELVFEGLALAAEG